MTKRPDFLFRPFRRTEFAELLCQSLSGLTAFDPLAHLLDRLEGKR